MALTSSFRLRSFVRRGGRGTAGQARAQDLLGPSFGLRVQDGLLDLPQVFGRNAPCYLEIGFGSGQSLLALAKAHPENNYIGVETHQPGIGALLMGVEQTGITNLRVFDADIIDVLEKCLPAQSLAGALIFFPDPWQKRRHHARRLVQTHFILQLISKIQHNGILHLATDWEDYAKHMRQTLSTINGLRPTAGIGTPAERSIYRPILTKFERRALREGRQIHDFQFVII